MLMDIISTIIVVIILCAVISGPVGVFNLRVFQAFHETKCSGLNTIKAFVPFCNVTFARRLAYANTVCYTIWLCVCALLLLFRLIAVALVSIMPLLVVFSALGTVASIALYYVLYVYNAVDFCRMFNCGAVTVLCCIAIPPVGYYMLSTQVLAYFRSVEDEVSGRFGA